MSDSTLITCSRGMGKLLEERCADYWLRANGYKRPVHARRDHRTNGSNFRSTLHLDKCPGCPDGERRANGLVALRTKSAQPRKDQQS